MYSFFISILTAFFIFILQVTSSGESGGGQALSSPGSCIEALHLPTFMECLGGGYCSFYINNIDYWLAQRSEGTASPGLYWSLGYVYNGLDEIIERGVARCTVCVRNTV